MTSAPARRRPIWVDAVLLGFAAAAFVGMILLGNWQMDRLAWKLNLIEQVETRAYAAPVDAQVAEDLPTYQRVRAAGTFDHDQTRKVKAVTELGAGQWIVTPLITDDGVIWVNRGFVPAGTRDADINAPLEHLEVTGLVRDSVPAGTLLEKNDPVAERWFSIDVAALSATAGINRYAPYAIAADHSGNQDFWPRGGLTQLMFRNTHLSYALTWYAMAMLFLAGMGFVTLDRFRSS